MEAYCGKQLLFEGAGGTCRAMPCSIAMTLGRAASKVHSTNRTALVRSRPEAGLRPRHIASGFSGLRFDLQYGRNCVFRWNLR
jgi:hypothetical protein